MSQPRLPREPAGRPRSPRRSRRASLVMVLLVGGLVVAGSVGARLLWSDVPAAPAQSAVVVCWDGVRRPPADCGRPTGLDGLQYVFPRFDPGEDGCREVPHAAPTGGAAPPVEWRCSTTLDSTRVALTYSQRTSTQRGLSFIRSRYRGIKPVPSARTSLLTWIDPDLGPDGLFHAVRAYAHFPYAAAVAAPTPHLRDRALSRLRFRPAAQLSIRASTSS